jgi:hypothetical protein
LVQSKQINMMTTTNQVEQGQHPDVLCGDQDVSEIHL